MGSGELSKGKIMKRKQKGFTLVEIAIVLVIIGLLLGGILKGQEMITQAKIKNVVADFTGVSAAYYGYQDRYRAIPGDDPNADTRWTGAVKGTGDGIVLGPYNENTDNTQETRKWWDHLRRAGFVSGSGYIQPFNAVTGMIGVQTGNGLGTGAAMGGISGLMMCSANLPDKIAIAVDMQMDDGAPDKGNVRGDLQTTPNPALDNAPQTAYAETGTNVYVLCRAL
jgi:prepilin-type N-terminal cleavage/methylation domain-containing protein